MRKIEIFIFTFLLLLGGANQLYSQQVEDDYEKFQTGQSCFFQGKYEEARHELATLKSDEAKRFYELSLELFAWQSKAEEYFREGLYQRGLETCKEILKKNPSDKKTKKIQEDCENALERKRQERQHQFDEAVSSMSEEKLRSFIEKYDKQPEWVEKATVVLNDLQLWNTARSVNTKQAYQNYISSSSSKTYVSEAESYLGQFESEDAWSRIKDSRNLKDFVNYKTHYSQYGNHLLEADAHINLLKGLEDYENGNLSSAYSYLNKAKSSNKVRFSSSDESVYSRATDYKEYLDLGYYASVSELQSYLHKHPQSDYCDEVRSRIAKKFADGLDARSTRSDYKKARSMVEDGATKSYVEERISSSKRQKRVYNRVEYGKVFTGGFDASVDLNDFFYGLELGFDLRFGRYSDWVNFTLGANYGLIYCFSSSSADPMESSSFLLSQVVTFPAHLKLNFIPTRSNCRMFFGCGYELGVQIFPDETEILDNMIMSYIPEFGVSAEHVVVDFYFKKYIQLYGRNSDRYFNGAFFSRETVKRDWVIGTRLIAYF